MRTKTIVRHVLGLGAVLLIVAIALGDDFTDTGKLMMWKVDSQAGTTYILGSLHFGAADIYPLDPAIEDAYAKSVGLELEMNMDMDTQMQAASLMQQEGMYAGDQTLSANLTDQEGGKVQDYLQARGMTMASVDGMKPWFAAVYLAAQEMARLGYDPQSGLDMHFYQKAVQSGKYTDGLESPEEQVGSLTSALGPVQTKELVEFADQAGGLSDAYDKMAAAWKAGDVRGLNRLIQENSSQDPDVKAASDQIIEGRNARMADRIAILANSGKTFFVIIGAAHLVTDRSVLKLLRDKGFTVTQVDKSSPQQQPAAAAVDSTAPRLESTAPAPESTDTYWHSPPPEAPPPAGKKPSSAVLLPMSSMSSSRERAH